MTEEYILRIALNQKFRKKDVMSLRSRTEENTARAESVDRERTGRGAKEVIRYLTPRLILLFCGYFARKKDIHSVLL